MSDIKNSGKAVIEGGDIVIRVAIEALETIIGGVEELWNGEGEPMFRVADATVFAADVVRSLNDEDDRGYTRIHGIFDAAIAHAVEYDAEGIEERTAPERTPGTGTVSYGPPMASFPLAPPPTVTGGDFVAGVNGGPPTATPMTPAAEPGKPATLPHAWIKPTMAGGWACTVKARGREDVTCDRKAVVFCEDDHGNGTCLEGRCREHARTPAAEPGKPATCGASANDGTPCVRPPHPEDPDYHTDAREYCWMSHAPVTATEGKPR